LPIAIIIVLFVALLGALSLKLVDKKEYGYAYMILIIGIIIGVPRITESLRQPDDGSHSTMLLSSDITKEREGNLPKAETYYRVAAKLASSDETRKPILGKADELQKKRTQKLLGIEKNGATVR
jgi:hypothetical protein